MVSDVLGMLTDMFVQLLGLFDRIISELDGWDVLLGAFIVYTVYRLLLVPIAGHAISAGASDVVKKMRNDSYETKNAKAVSGLEKGKE